LLELQPELAGKLTRVMLPPMQGQSLRFLLSDCFPAITQLDMMLSGTPHAEMVTLAQMNALTDLSFRYSDRFRQLSLNEPKPFEELVQNDLLHMPVLVSVRRLLLIGFD